MPYDKRRAVVGILSHALLANPWIASMLSQSMKPHADETCEQSEADTASGPHRVSPASPVGSVVAVDEAESVGDRTVSLESALSEVSDPV